MAQSNNRIGGLQIGIILLTLVTAVVHLVLGILQLTIGMMGGVMFLLNAVGYVAFLSALYLSLPIPFVAQNRALVRWAFVAFAAVTILGWVAIGERNIVGYADKFIEVVLIALLVVEGRNK